MSRRHKIVSRPDRIWIDLNLLCLHPEMRHWWPHSFTCKRCIARYNSYGVNTLTHWAITRYLESHELPSFLKCAEAREQIEMQKIICELYMYFTAQNYEREPSMRVYAAREYLLRVLCEQYPRRLLWSDDMGHPRIHVSRISYIDQNI